MQPIRLIPLIDACDFTHEVDDEMAINEVNTHYHGDIIHIEWSDEEDFPETQKWLIETYGEEIKKYDQFSIMPT